MGRTAWRTWRRAKVCPSPALAITSGRWREWRRHVGPGLNRQVGHLKLELPHSNWIIDVSVIRITWCKAIIITISNCLVFVLTTVVLFRVKVVLESVLLCPQKWWIYFHVKVWKPWNCRCNVAVIHNYYNFKICQNLINEVFFLLFPCCGGWDWCTAAIVNFFHRSLLLAFSLHFSSSSAFLGSLFSHNPSMLAVVFLVSLSNFFSIIFYSDQPISSSSYLVAQWPLLLLPVSVMS